MNRQFDDELAADLAAKRLARSGDPISSHEAAADFAREHLGRAQAAAFELVQKHPGKTAKELDVLAGWDVHKRLLELVRQSRIQRGPRRQCTVSGRLVGTWLPRNNA